MSDRKQASIDRINELWGLHEPQDEELKTEGRCLAFVIDPRYVEQEGVEMRLGVSFGHNVVTPQTRQGFLGIPAYPGEFVFGIHGIGTKGNQLTLYDRWYDARQAGDCTDAMQGEERACAILESMSDDDYFKHVREAQEDKRLLKVSDRYLLEDFEVVEGEAW
jgi:hypothetical protein